mgnify:CR=1 FL=1
MSDTYKRQIQLVGSVEADTSEFKEDIKNLQELLNKTKFKAELTVDDNGALQSIKKSTKKIKNLLAEANIGDKIGDSLSKGINFDTLNEQLAKSFANINFSPLTNALQDAIKDGVNLGGKSIEETLVDKRAKLKTLNEANSKDLEKIAKNAYKQFKDYGENHDLNAANQELLKAFKPTKSDYDSITRLKNWMDGVRTKVAASPFKDIIDDVDKQMQQEIAKATVEINELESQIKSLEAERPKLSVTVDTSSISKAIEELKTLMNLQELLATQLDSKSKNAPTIGGILQNANNAADEFHRVIYGYDGKDGPLALNVSGIKPILSQIQAVRNALGVVYEESEKAFNFDNSLTKQIQQVVTSLKEMSTILSEISTNMSYVASNTLLSSASYQSLIEKETANLQNVNDQLDEQIRKREALRDLVNTTASSGTKSAESKAIYAAQKHEKEKTEYISNLTNDLKDSENKLKDLSDKTDKNSVAASKKLQEHVNNLKQKLSKIETHGFADEYFKNNQKKIAKGTQLLREYLQLGGDVSELNVTGKLSKESELVKKLSNEKEIIEALNEQNKLKQKQAQINQQLKEHTQMLEVAKANEVTDKPQDIPQDTTPLDLKVDEFNAALDSTSSHFEKLNAAISDTTNGLNKQDEKDGDQRIPNRLKQYAMTPGEFANIHSTIENNAIDLFENSNYDDMDLSVEQMANGLAKVSANLRDSTGEWKKFTAIADRAGNIIETKFKTVKPDAQTKLEESWQKSRKIDTQDTEKELLSVSEQLEQAELIRDSLGLEDSSKWSVTVDERGFVTIKDNLLEVEDATVQATRKFNDFNEAIDKFESSAKNITLSNQKKTTGGTDEISTDFINDILKSTKENYKQDYIQQISTLKAYKDKGLYNVDDYRDIVSDGFLAINKMFALSKDKTYITDFSNDELAQMINLYERLQNAVKQAGDAAQKAQDNFGKLMDASKLNTEATKMLKYLDSNTNAAEKYGDTIRNLAEQMRNAITDKDFKRIQEEFTNIQYKIQSEGLTGKSSGLTVSDASIKKISSALDTKTLETRIKKLRNLYQTYASVGLANSTQLSTTMSSVDEKFDNIGKINIGEASDDDLRNLVNTYNDLTDAIKLAENELKELQRTHGRVMSDSEKTIASNQIKKWLQENSRAAKAYGETLERLAQQMKEVTTETEYKGIMSEFKAITSKAAAEGLTGRSWFTEIKDTFSHITQIFGSYSLVDVFQDLGRAGVENIRLVDDALTDLRMSAGLAKDDAEEMMETYSQIGNDMAVLSTDLAKASTDWIKQGESIESATQLAQDSIVLSVLGDVESSEATTYLTSALKGYQLAADEAMNVVDKISTVDIMSATSVGGLAEGMSEVATQANLANISMDDLLGYLAAIGEVTQDDMSSVGGALNTIFARMGAIKLGRLDDYQEETGEDLSNVETVLRNEGIALRDASGEFRNFKEVLDEVAAKWDSLGSVSQNAVAQAFAGKLYARTCSNAWVLL